MQIALWEWNSDTVVSESLVYFKSQVALYILYQKGFFGPEEDLKDECTVAKIIESHKWCRFLIHFLMCGSCF